MVAIRRRRRDRFTGYHSRDGLPLHLAVGDSQQGSGRKKTLSRATLLA